MQPPEPQALWNQDAVDLHRPRHELAKGRHIDHGDDEAEDQRREFVGQR